MQAILFIMRSYVKYSKITYEHKQYARKIGMNLTGANEIIQLILSFRPAKAGYMVIWVNRLLA